MPKRNSFIALQSFFSRLDRLYRVRIIDDGLLAGYVAGQFYRREQAELMFAAAEINLFPLFRPLVRRAIRRRRYRQQAYRKLLPDPRVYPAADRRNFTIERLHVASITLKHGRSVFRAVDSIATIQIELASGRPYNLLIVGRQNCNEIAAALRSTFPDLRVVGEPVPLVPRPRRRLPSDAKNDRLMTIAVLCFVVAIALVSTVFFVKPAWPVTTALVTGAAACGIAFFALIRRWRQNEAKKSTPPM